MTSLLAHEPVAQLLGGLRTRMGAGYWIAVIVIAAGASSAKLDSRLRLWFSAIYIWVLPTALFALFQALNGTSVSAAFGNDNLYGLAMLLMVPPAIGLAFTTRSMARRGAWLAVAAILATSIVAAGARAATGALVVEGGLCLGVLALVVLPERIRPTVRSVGLTIAGFGTAAMLAVAMVGSAGPEVAPFWLARAFGPTFSTRAYIWSGALRSFATSPIVGHGPLGYQFAGQRFIQPGLMSLERGGTFLTVTPAEPHSIVLRLLVAMGLLGAVAVGFAVWGWFSAIRRTESPSVAAVALRNSFVAATAGFALGSLFGPWLLTVGALPAVIIGLACAGFGKEEQLPDPPRAVRPIAGTAIAVFLLGLAISVTGEASGYARSLTAQSLESRSAYAQEAVAAAPYSLEARFSQLWTQGDSASKGEGDVGAFQRAVDADAMVSAYAPALAELVRLSLVQAESTGRRSLDWERSTLSRAASLGPGIPDAFAEQLHLALVSGDAAAIKTALEAGRGLCESYPRWAAYAAQAQAVPAAK